MNNLDHISINFNHSQVIILNICLGILMFGVALDLRLSDFSYILKNPKPVFAGLFSQWVLLPLISIALIWIIRPEYSLAMGMLLIASCPGGNVSNYAVHLSGANAALSVILTTISTLFCVVSTPLIFSFTATLLPVATENSIDFEISFIGMALTIGQLIIIPLILGQLFIKFFPKTTQSIKKPVRMLSLLIFIGFVIFAITGNLENLKKYVGHVFYIVLIHNGLALFMGFFWSKNLMKLPLKDAQAISIETGIQNSGLALILIFNFFGGKGGMALIAAWWSIWHLLSASSLAFFWSRNRN